MSVITATRIAECPIEQQQQQHSSSSMRLSDEDTQQQQQQQVGQLAKKCRRRTRRRRSECTETGSIGYGSSAPLESETSYSSHPGYPACAGAVAAGPEMQIQIVQSPPPPLHLHQLQQQQQQQQQQTSSAASQSSTSTPSSGAYVDVSSSARLAASMSSSAPRKVRNALVRNRAAAVVSAGPTPPASSWNAAAASAAGEAETSYVVDAEKGNAYYKGALLGKGGFARVYLITEIASHKQFACKIIPKHQMQKVHMQKIAREIMIHKELNHVNVVQMHHYFEDSLNVYMLLEACPKKSLVHVLKYRGKVTEPEARYYMRQMATGVAYIHSQKVIHRDLKPGNMFLSDRMIVKIGDFGLATHPDGQRRRVTICGTPNFIAPEVLFKQAYSYEADVWALGCILYVLLVGQPPFDSATLKETYSRICNHRYKQLDDATATRAGQDLVRWLLQPNPDLRPSLELVKEHPYLTQEYVPSSLPDSCCYQVPRLPLADRQNPLASFSSSLNFSQPHHHHHHPHPHQQQGGNLEQQIQQQQQQQQQQHSQAAAAAARQTSQKSQDSKKSNGKSSKKKKVSSWLASLRLPKLPRFRQRISSVLCLEARKKQALTCQQPEDEHLLLGCTSIQQMAKALEDCLAGQSRRPGDATGVKVGTEARLEENAAPLFVTKWIDFSNKYGLAFQLSDKSVGVLFNDSTKMSYTHDRRRVEYISSDEEMTRYNREKNVPEHLQEKLGLLRHFTDYMDKHLTEGGEVLDHRGQNRPAAVLARGASAVSGNVPQMRRWIRTSKAIVMELSVPLLQMNFFDDHTKFIVSQQNANYLVTYIDGERRASSYWLTDLRDSGCSPDLHERMLYVYKVAKEFADLDLGAP